MHYMESETTNRCSCFFFFSFFFYTEYFFSIKFLFIYHLLDEEKKMKIQAVYWERPSICENADIFVCISSIQYTSIYSQNAKLLQNEERIILFDTFCFSSLPAKWAFISLGLSFSIHFGEISIKDCRKIIFHS